MTVLELTHFRRECRLLSILLVSDLIFQMLQTAVLIWTGDSTITANVAMLSGYPDLMVAAFVACALLVVPYLFVQVFKPDSSCRKYVVKAACGALCATGVLRVYMGWLSKNLDYDTVTWIFIRGGVWAIALGAILAYGLNNKQIRDEKKDSK